MSIGGGGREGGPRVRTTMGSSTVGVPCFCTDPPVTGAESRTSETPWTPPGPAASNRSLPRRPGGGHRETICREETRRFHGCGASQVMATSCATQRWRWVIRFWEEQLNLQVAWAPRKGDLRQKGDLSASAGLSATWSERSSSRRTLDPECCSQTPPLGSGVAQDPSD